MKRKFNLVLAVVLALTLIVTFSPYLKQTVVKKPPTAEKGILDLQKWSFEKDGPIDLEGEWSFYFNQFLRHEDFLKGNPANGYFIKVPSTKQSMNDVKPFPSNRFYGTLRLVIKLPAEPVVYGLRTNFVLSSHKLFINGKYFGEIGKVGTSEKTQTPYYTIMNSYFYPDRNELELIYQTSDFCFEDCAILPPILGHSDQITGLAKAGSSRDLFLFGMLLIMGIYHLGLYYMRKKDSAPLCFGVFCLSFSLRLLLVGERILPEMLHMNYVIYVKLAYTSVFVGFFALCAFVYYSFPALFHKRFINVCMFSMLSAIILGFIVNILWLDYLLILYCVIGFPMMGFALWILGRGVWKGVPFSSGVLIGYILLVFTIVNDLIYEVTLSNRGSLIPFGVAVFIFTQAYTLSAKFSNAFEQAELLSEENAVMMVQLKDMNANLEGLVEERTKDLKHAMEEMDVMSKLDYLTKLPNRRLMFQRIDKLITERTPFFLALIDIDKFKDVNDTFGHDKGDEILKGASAAMAETLGENGYVGRWGGEEFLMVLLTDRSTEALALTEAVRERISSCTYDSVPVQITITIGVCRYASGMGVDTCIANADNALYTGKANGRNQCQLYT